MYLFCHLVVCSDIMKIVDCYRFQDEREKRWGVHSTCIVNISDIFTRVW